MDHRPVADWICSCGFDFFGGSAAYSWQLFEEHLPKSENGKAGLVTLTEFLLARLDEEERAYRDFRDVHGGVGVSPRLVDVASKRAIVQSGRSWCSGYNDPMASEVASDLGLPEWKHYPDPEWAHCDGCAAAEAADEDYQRVLRHLASVYADHPDYREEWRL